MTGKVAVAVVSVVGGGTHEVALPRMHSLVARGAQDASSLEYAFYIFPLGDGYTVSEGA